MKKILSVFLVLVLVVAALIFFQRQRVLTDLQDFSKGKSYQGSFFKLVIPPFEPESKGIFEVLVPVPQAFLETEALGPVAASKIELKGLSLSQGLWFGQSQHLNFPESFKSDQGWTLEGIQLVLGSEETIRSWKTQRLTYEAPKSQDLAQKAKASTPKIAIEGLGMTTQVFEDRFPLDLQLQAQSFLMEDQEGAGESKEEVIFQVKDIEAQYFWNKEAQSPEGGPTPEWNSHLAFENLQIKDSRYEANLSQFKVNYQVLYEAGESPRQGWEDLLAKVSPDQRTGITFSGPDWFLKNFGQPLRPNKTQVSLVSLEFKEPEEERVLLEDVSASLDSSGDESLSTLAFKLSLFSKEPTMPAFRQADFKFKQSTRFPWIAINQLIEAQKTGQYEADGDPFAGQKVLYDFSLDSDLGKDFFSGKAQFKADLPLEGLFVGLPKLSQGQNSLPKTWGVNFENWALKSKKRFEEALLEKALLDFQLQLSPYSRFQKFLDQQAGASSTLVLAAVVPYMVIDSQKDELKSQIRLEKGKVLVNGEANPALQSFLEVMKPKASQEEADPLPQLPILQNQPTP
ncbi:MAG: hypothetical protein KDK66_06210 [Deltaproteobacteria bacterium]|nr:hypothetical protein [Deltaproteobacteria bacterium]